VLIIKVAEMNIEVFDDVLENSLLEFVREELNILTWMQQKSHLLKTDEKMNFFFASVEQNLFTHQFLYNLICKKYNISNKFSRSYVNCHPPHSSGNFHTDDGDLTLLFYPDKNEKNKGGTEFKDATNVDYKTNRLIIFDAKILHKANINLSNEMRYSIAWKTIK
jgi:hypothetical protein|tara:strand:- start:1434 stop:1925 length:492 start_codon:yes stop_codon:yes gene_type:complete